MTLERSIAIVCVVYLYTLAGILLSGLVRGPDEAAFVDLVGVEDEGMVDTLHVHFPPDSPKGVFPGKVIPPPEPSEVTKLQTQLHLAMAAKDKAEKTISAQKVNMQRSELALQSALSELQNLRRQSRRRKLIH
jgi:hypothetical protein